MAPKSFFSSYFFLPRNCHGILECNLPTIKNEYRENVNHYLVDFLNKKKQQAIAHPVYYTKIHYTTLHHTLLHYFTTLHNYRINTHHPKLSCMDTSCFFRTVLVNTLLSQLSHQFVMFGWYVFIDSGFSVKFIITMVTYTSHA